MSNYLHNGLFTLIFLIVMVFKRNLLYFTKRKININIFFSQFSYNAYKERMMTVSFHFHLNKEWDLLFVQMWSEVVSLKEDLSKHQWFCAYDVVEFLSFEVYKGNSKLPFVWTYRKNLFELLWSFWSVMSFSCCITSPYCLYDWYNLSKEQ